jgi:Ca2+-binding RTX toxin-like protein
MALLKVGPAETYHTIADAMAHANVGDTIALDAGYSNETTTVNVNNLSVSGTSSSANIDLTLAAGITSLTLLGTAPIFVHDNAGNNTITGNGGANTIEVSGGTDVVNGGGGNDRLIVDYSAATATITGTVGGVTDGGTNAVTFTDVRRETVLTGSGDDTITANSSSNIIDTGAGNDTVTGGNGKNIIDGGLGNDTLTAGSATPGNGDDRIDGGAGNDTLSGGSGNNILTGDAGNDTLNGGTGTSLLAGGAGINILNGGTGNSTADYFDSRVGVTVTLAVAGSQQVSTLQNDTLNSIENLIGSAHKDTLTASTSGDNTLTGGAQADHLIAGGGHDIFNYGLATDSTSKAYDTVSGFDTRLDTLQFSSTVTAIDTEITHGRLSTPTFDRDLTLAADASHLAAHGAVLFTPTSGTLRGDTFLVIDHNGTAGYQAGQDFVIELTGAAHLASLSTADFVV